MLQNPIFLLAASTLLAAIPAGIWLYILFSKGVKSKKVVALVFILGIVITAAWLGFQYIWDLSLIKWIPQLIEKIQGWGIEEGSKLISALDFISYKFPTFDLEQFFDGKISNPTTMFLVIFVIFAGFEEIIKHFVVRGVDKRTLLIQKIGDAITYSFAAALGFAFFENIWYLYQYWPSISTGELTGLYVFRSTFTTLGHLVFSGIFGYYYGIGKFSIDLTEQAEIAQKESMITRMISKVLKLPRSQANKEKLILKGLLIATVMHTIQNSLLHFSGLLNLLGVMIMLILGYAYLRYLLKRKTGHLMLITDVSTKQKSSMAKTDEDVILELMGMWFKKKKYVDVIHICERLLERDPDNNVVKLFKAQAMDKMDNKNIYKDIISKVIKSKEDMTVDDKSLINKYLTEKEKIEKSKVEQKPKKK